MHSTLPQGKGYTSVEIKVNYLKGGPPDQWRAHRDGHGRQVRLADRFRRGRRHRRLRSGRRHRHQHAAGLRSVTPASSSATFDAVPKQIVVIGAGIAGLATAVALQQRGHDVTVLEERTDASSGAGISIWPNALAALDQIGSGRPRSSRRWPGHRGSTALARRQVVTPPVTGTHRQGTR